MKCNANERYTVPYKTSLQKQEERRAAAEAVANYVSKRLPHIEDTLSKNVSQNNLQLQPHGRWP